MDLRHSDRIVIEGGNRILPQKAILIALLRAEIAFAWPHVAVGQLVPRLRKGLGKGIEVVQELLAHRAIGRVDLQGDISGHHHQRIRLTRYMGVGGPGCRLIGGDPLQRTGRTLRLNPLVFKQIFEVSVVPLRRIWRPAAFDAVGHRVFTEARAFRVVPTEAHRLDGRDLGRRPNVFCRHHAVTLAEGVTAGDQSDCFLVIHRHTTERDADVARRPHRIAVSVRTLWVDVDQRLVGRSQRVLKVVIGVAVPAPPALVASHHAVERRNILRIPDFGTPIGAGVSLPRVAASATEAVGREPHDLERAVTGQDHEVAPR